MEDILTPTLFLDALPANDIGELATTLRAERLPHTDLSGGDKRFFCASEDGVIVGYVGLEIYGTDALLRSAVIFRRLRRRGYGRIMIERLIDVAISAGVERIWLLTQSAPEFFEKLGFLPIERAKAPPTLATSEEFSSLCPKSAAFMMLNLDVFKPHDRKRALP